MSNCTAFLITEPIKACCAQIISKKVNFRSWCQVLLSPEKIKEFALKARSAEASAGSVCIRMPCPECVKGKARTQLWAPCEGRAFVSRDLHQHQALLQHSNWLFPKGLCTISSDSHKTSASLQASRELQRLQGQELIGVAGMPCSQWMGNCPMARHKQEVDLCTGTYCSSGPCLWTRCLHSKGSSWSGAGP